MTYCISDIHGEYMLFEKLLTAVSFSQKDTLIVLGDIIDKGEGSVRLLWRIFGMPNARVIMGNHEHMFLKLYHSLMESAEGDFDSVLEKLREYFPNDGQLLDWDIIDRIDALPAYVEAEDYICVHSGAPLDSEGRLLPLSAAEPEALLYDRGFKEIDVRPKDSKCVLFGHTPTSYHGEKYRGKIIAYRRQGTEGNKISDYFKIHLDTGAWNTGTLGCFCIETCKAHYVKKEA